MNVRGTGNGEQTAAEDGFMLLGLIVAIAIILFVLGTAASKAAFSIRRDRELESARRADQYVRAIRKFYLKNQRYPASIEQLENTNMVRYLRQRYVDPLTGKANYRLILVGQNKTTVKGFFGKPLEGLPSAGLGAAAGMQSTGIGAPLTANGIGGATGAGGIGGAGAVGTSGSFGSGAAGAAGSFGGGAAGSSGAAGATTGSPSTSGGFGSQMGSGFPGSTGPFMGVGSSATGNSILVENEQTSYETWEFLYDPRIEKLKLAAAMNGGIGSTGAGSLGTTPGAFGSAPSGFGSTPSGFGSGNGTSPTNSAGPGGSATPTTQP